VRVVRPVPVGLIGWLAESSLDIGFPGLADHEVSSQVLRDDGEGDKPQD
jgi:hypothetical protein